MRSPLIHKVVTIVRGSHGVQRTIAHSCGARVMVCLHIVILRFWPRRIEVQGESTLVFNRVVGSPRITDPRGSKTPPLPPPQNDPRITDHLPHKPPPPTA